MTKTIQISTDVFAAIWAARVNGEENENDILHRVLIGDENKKSSDTQSINNTHLGGYYDSRNDVHFPNGFKAFRHYKGRTYKAEVVNAMWLRVDTGEYYSSLNKLNESIVAGNENIWNGNWRAIIDGRAKSLNVMRK